MEEVKSPNDTEVINGNFVTDFTYIKLHFLTAVKRFMAIDNYECTNIHHILSDYKKIKLFNVIVYSKLFISHLKHQYAHFNEDELTEFGIEKKNITVLKDVQLIMNHVKWSNVTKDKLLRELSEQGLTELEKMGIMPHRINSKLSSPYMWRHDHPLPKNITEDILERIPDDKWKEDLNILIYPCGMGKDAEIILDKLIKAGHDKQTALNMLYLDDDREENILFTIALIGGGHIYKDV